MMPGRTLLLRRILLILGAHDTKSLATASDAPDGPDASDGMDRPGFLNEPLKLQVAILVVLLVLATFIQKHRR